MPALQALYFDGKTSGGREVFLELDPRRGLCVRGDGLDQAWPISDVRASERIGGSRRRLYFPDGAQCETADNDAVDALFEGQSPAAARLLHRWESGARYALAALAITVATAWAAIAWGLPALAKQVAFALPADTERLLGRDALASLDRIVFAPSALPPARQASLRALLAGMANAAKPPTDYRLEFRKGGRVGANALALPAGIIVMTDELVALAKDDRELEAVLAHEVGHLRQHHTLRQVLQNSTAALLVAVTLGDLTSLTSLAAAAPTLLLQAKYSRDFEREADDYALAWLAKRGIPAEAFAAILQRMEDKRPGGQGAPDYLSSHPATRERIERAKGKR